MSNAFLDTLLQDFVAWAQANDACRSVVLVGSATRSVRPADQYSDRDILLFVTNPDSDEYIEWMRQYAPLWMVIREHNAPTLLWLVVYRGGKSLHLSINSVDDLQQIVDTRQLWTDHERGYKILLDKDNLAVQMPPAQVPAYQMPSETEFVECVESFLYGTLLIGKQIKRGNLWTVKWAYGIEQRFMLKLLEWHARAHNDDVDTWHRGEFMHDWLDDETWQALHGVFGRFDADDSWRALLTGVSLFSKLARETAAKLDYDYPETTANEITAYLETLRTEAP